MLGIVDDERCDKTEEGDDDDDVGVLVPSQSGQWSVEFQARTQVTERSSCLLISDLPTTTIINNIIHPHPSGVVCHATSACTTATKGQRPCPVTAPTLRQLLGPCQVRALL
jgi:3-oxoacyl-(acyl-carrier-protein) synthase